MRAFVIDLPDFGAGLEGSSAAGGEAELLRRPRLAVEDAKDRRVRPRALSMSRLQHSHSSGPLLPGITTQRGEERRRGKRRGVRAVWGG